MLPAFLSSIMASSPTKDYSLGVLSTPMTLEQSFLGGCLIGLSAGLYLYFSGTRAGLSGIYSVFINRCSYKASKTSFLSGIVLASLAANIIRPDLFDQLAKGPVLDWRGNAIAGLLVGFGTRLGNGCTSGHGVCGLPRLSKRGLVAVCTFMATGFLTSTLVSNSRMFREPAVDPYDARWGTTDHRSAWNLAMLGLGMLLLFWDLPSKYEEGLGLNWSSWACGAIFAVGLAISKMAVRQKVLNFLWVSPQWDPSLMMVMGGACLVNLLPTQYLHHHVGQVARFDPKVRLWTGKSLWQISKAEKVDSSLVLGAAIFGVGWGLGGVCPGPAMLLFVAGFPRIVLAFLPCMTLGMALHTVLWGGSPMGPSPSTMALNRCVVEEEAVQDRAKLAVDENLRAPLMESPNLRRRPHAS